MTSKRINIDEVKCSKTKYNKVEVEFWKKAFLARKRIPAPVINSKKEVTAFYSSYFALKELKIPKIVVSLQV